MNLIPLFENTAEQQQHAAGDIIFNRGDEAKAMYVVLEGEVDLHVDNAVYTVGPGELFGEMALIANQGRLATAIARSHCRLAQVSERRFLFLVEQTSYFSLHVMRVLAERLQRATHHS